MKSNYTFILRLLFSFVFVAGISLGLASNSFAQEKDDDDKPNPKLAKKAKITMEAAREIALKKVPGTVIEGELEKEHGKLVYSFDIKIENGKIMEVWVDAKTGNVLRAEEDKEDDDDDGKDDDDDTDG